MKHLFSCGITGEVLCGACYKSGGADKPNSLWDFANGKAEY
jgi:hypothetical protein